MDNRVSARPRVRAVTADLIVSDLQRSIDFYCDKLGFIELETPFGLVLDARAALRLVEEGAKRASTC